MPALFLLPSVLLLLSVYLLEISLSFHLLSVTFLAWSCSFLPSQDQPEWNLGVSGAISIFCHRSPLDQDFPPWNFCPYLCIELWCFSLAHLCFWREFPSRTDCTVIPITAQPWVPKLDQFWTKLNGKQHCSSWEAFSMQDQDRVSLISTRWDVFSTDPGSSASFAAQSIPISSNHFPAQKCIKSRNICIVWVGLIPAWHIHWQYAVLGCQKWVNIWIGIGGLGAITAHREGG